MILYYADKYFLFYAPTEAEKDLLTPRLSVGNSLNV
jgi:hypothetical protein